METKRKKYETVRNAASRLGTSPEALRAHLRRRRRTPSTDLIDLGGGICAFKFGRRWRVAFPEGDEGVTP
jgi:hypothetical protein